jgi:cellobiose epimerase
LQVSTADLWNGGLDGNSGMGAYDPEFNGFFKPNLDREWKSSPGSSTAVAQARGVYMNVEAFRAAGPEEGERFLKAINQGVDFMLENFLDDRNGGFYWSVYSNGRVDDNLKQGYGNIHSIFALAQAYSVTQNPAHLQAALDQLAVFDKHFRNRDYACALYPSFSRNWNEIVGVNNVDIFTHYFETLLVLHDVTEGDQQARIDEQISICGDFLVDELYHDQEGFTDRGYVAYNYDENWQPSQIPYTREMQWSGALHATTGHNIELAFLISRAVERGFDERWLETAEKLIKFCTEYAIDPVTGGMLYEITDYDGKPLEGNPDNELYLWWPQTETARTLMHFAVVRGHDEFLEPFKKVETLVQGDLTDQAYGGLYIDLNKDTLQPTSTHKADIWKVNYHDAMFFAEALRLAEKYPDRVAELDAVAEPQ